MKNRKRLLLVGAGVMAREYAKVLNDMDIYYEVVARGKANAEKMRNISKATVHEGGIDVFLDKNGIDSFDFFINAANAEELSNISCKLLALGANNLLIEKPGFISEVEGEKIRELSVDKRVYIAYNRRFLQSVDKALEIIKCDGGVSSFSFEFTEWRSVFDNFPNEIKHRLDFLFLGNSSHVADMAFFLSGGKPVSLSSYIGGINCIDWHKMGCSFAGAGRTDTDALFTYTANWDAPGRWGVEINTSKHRLIFRPLERLQIMDVGTVNICNPEIDYSVDVSYKPGLFKEIESFVFGNNRSRLCTIDEQFKMIPVYREISGEKY